MSRRRPPRRHSRSLEDRIGLLEERARRGRLRAAGAEALAEAYSRSATRPGVPSGESVRLLRRAVRIDTTNPKHAYLLARAYFAHGAFEQAQRWLREAIRHNPTSHRIWAHIALLQRELNVRYHGDANYEADDLRHRAAEVLRRVRAGADALTPELLGFEPRASSKQRAEAAVPSVSDAAAGVPHAAANGGARRRLDAGACRWTGAADLALESVLEGAPNEIACRKGRVLLIQAARLASMRHGGMAGFVILAIQWCLAGFPLETVEHVRRTCSPDLDTPSLRLLDLVCRCFRVPPEELPAVLSAAMTSGDMPPLLAALIHQRILLWQRLDARAFVKHGAGRRWLERHDASKPNRVDRSASVAQALSQGAAGLAARPRPVVVDAAVKAAGTSTPEDWIAAIDAIEKAIGEIATIVDGASAVAHSGDAAAIKPVTEALEEAAARAAARLDDLLRAMWDAPPPAGVRVRADRCRRALTRAMYLTPIAARFAHASHNGSSPSNSDAPLDRWREQAAAILAAPEIVAETIEDCVSRLGRDPEPTAARLDADFKRLQELLRTKRERGLDAEAIAEGQRIAAHVGEADTKAQSSLREIADLRSSGRLTSSSAAEGTPSTSSSSSPSPSPIAQLATIEQKWRDITSSLGKFKRLLASLALPPVTSSEPAVAARPVDTPVDRPVDAPAVTPVGATSPPTDTHDSAPQTGAAAVRHALVVFERAVEARFTAARATFDAYTEDQRAEPALAALRWTIAARQAETFYRFGRKADARRLWVQLLRTDRLAAPVLKNVAIALTGGVERGGERAAWRDYCEALYFQANVQANVTPGAAARAAFHGHFGRGYAPGWLCRERRDQEPLGEAEEAEIVSFLNTPRRVRTFVDHLRLEWLNRKLDIATPTLFLGCERSVTEQVRNDAAAKLKRFVTSCRVPLPVRVADTFVARAHQQIDAALARCRDVRTLLDDAAYKADYAKQVALLRDFVNLKMNLVDGILRSVEAPRRVSGLGAFEILEYLDEVPLDLSPALYATIHHESEMLARYMALLHQKFARRVKGLP
jgi:hypothetical protein